jgi:hypothetical protein
MECAYNSVSYSSDDDSIDTLLKDTTVGVPTNTLTIKKMVDECTQTKQHESQSYFEIFHSSIMQNALEEAMLSNASMRMDISDCVKSLKYLGSQYKMAQVFC